MEKTSDNPATNLVGRIRLPIGSPILLRSKDPEYEVGGFVNAMGKDIIAISYNPPQNLVGSIALSYMDSMGDRGYCLSGFQSYRNLTEKFQKVAAKDSKEANKINEGMEAAIGDFILLRNEKQKAICGFITELYLARIKLSHENPLLKSQPQLRLEMTRGNRTFDLKYFTDYLIIKPQSEEDQP